MKNGIHFQNKILQIIEETYNKTHLITKLLRVPCGSFDVCIRLTQPVVVGRSKTTRTGTARAPYVRRFYVFVCMLSCLLDDMYMTGS